MLGPLPNMGGNGKGEQHVFPVLSTNAVLSCGTSKYGRGQGAPSTAICIAQTTLYTVYFCTLSTIYIVYKYKKTQFFSYIVEIVLNWSI